jgi:hypothetical protein
MGRTFDAYAKALEIQHETGATFIWLIRAICGLKTRTACRAVLYCRKLNVGILFGRGIL